MDANNFTIGNLPGIFRAAGISSMKVGTSTQTDFENVSSVSALNVGDLVSMRGPLFMMNGTPTLVASKVQKR
jgi:hypothetical protein